MGFFKALSHAFGAVKEEDKCALDCVEWEGQWAEKARETINTSFGGRAPCMFMAVSNQTAGRIVLQLTNDVDTSYWRTDVSIEALQHC